MYLLFYVSNFMVPFLEFTLFYLSVLLLVIPFSFLLIVFPKKNRKKGKAL